MREGEPPPSSASPVLYERIKSGLEEAMREGRLPVASRLPTEHQLCRDYGVSRITVRKALGILERDGCIERIRGKGSFVRKLPRSRALAPGVCTSRSLRCCLPAHIAQLLKIPDFKRALGKEFPGLSLDISSEYDLLTDPFQEFAAADLFALPYLFYRKARALNLLGDWREIMGDDRFERFVQDVPDGLANALGERRLRYLIPLIFSPLLVLINTRVLEKAGLEAPRFYWSEEEFLQLARQLASKFRGKAMVPFLCEMTNTRRWPFAIVREGGRLWCEDGLRCTLDSPECLRGIQFLKHLILDEQVAKAVSSGEARVDSGLFVHNRVGMQLGTITTARNLELSGHSDWVPVGIPEGRVRTTPCNEVSLAVAPRPKDPGLLAALMEFLRRPGTIKQSTDSLPFLLASRRCVRFTKETCQPRHRTVMEAFLRLEQETAPQDYPAIPEAAILLDQLIPHLWLDMQHAEERCREIACEVNRISAGAHL